MNDWRELVNPPLPRSTEWQARRGPAGRVLVGEAKISSELRRWHPFDCLMISTPGSDVLVPAITVSEVRQRVHEGCKARSRVSILILTVTVVLLAALSQISRNSSLAHFTYGLLCIDAFVIFDHFLVIRDAAALTDRSLFFLYLSRHCRIDLCIWTGAMVLIGAIQLVLQSTTGGLEKLILKYGAVYHQISIGEWWRLLIGPFFHTGVLHWASNFGILLPVAVIAGVVSRWRAAIIFLISSVAGAFAAWQFAKYGHDAYAGVSAGAFGLYGMLGAAALRNAENLPGGIGFTIISFAGVNMYLAEVLNPNSSGISHAAGFAVGIICGNFVQILSKKKKLD